MNRRDFLKVVTATAAVVAAPSLIPADAKFRLVGGYPSTGLARSPGGPGEIVIGNITRTIEWHSDRATHFVCYTGRINNADYYVGDFSDEVDEKSLRELDANALMAFRGKPVNQSIMITDAQLEAAVKAGKFDGDFPPYEI